MVFTHASICLVFTQRVKLKCRRCGKVQDFPKESPHCVECNLKFAEYFCAICQHLTGVQNNPFHCEKCGICRYVYNIDENFAISFFSSTAYVPVLQYATFYHYHISTTSSRLINLTLVSRSDQSSPTAKAPQRKWLGYYRILNCL